MPQLTELIYKITRGGGQIRFTMRENFLYAIALRYPAGPCVIKSLNKGNIAIGNVTLVGSSEAVKWGQSEKWLEFELPRIRPHKLGYALRIESAE